MSSDQIGFTLKDKFLNQPPETHTKHWDDLWQKQTTPWDRNGPSLALKDTITERQDLFGSPLANSKRKRALVPGCGRGYDVLLLSSLGYDCYGLDASQTAVDAALKVQKESSGDERYAAHDSKVGSGESKFLVENFFKDDFLEETQGGSFDVIFDYTFVRTKYGRHR